jgi:hypothetical protein
MEHVSGWSWPITALTAAGIRLPFFRSGDLGTSPSFEQLSVKTINLTVRQHTKASAYKIGAARKSFRERNCSL